MGPRRSESAKLRTDKGHDYGELRRWLRQRGITPRIARTDIESPQKPGRHRSGIGAQPGLAGWPAIAA